jgi:hypothetical protein
MRDGFLRRHGPASSLLRCCFTVLHTHTTRLLGFVGIENKGGMVMASKLNLEGRALELWFVAAWMFRLDGASRQRSVNTAPSLVSRNTSVKILIYNTSSDHCAGDQRLPRGLLAPRKLQPGALMIADRRC